MAEDERSLRAERRFAEGDASVRLRKPWTKPRVILSKAEHTQKTINTDETTFGPFHFGPS